MEGFTVIFAGILMAILEDVHEGIFKIEMLRGDVVVGGEGAEGHGTATGHGIALTTGEEGEGFIEVAAAAVVGSEVVIATSMVTMTTGGTADGMFLERIRPGFLLTSN